MRGNDRVLGNAVPMEEIRCYKFFIFILYADARVLGLVEMCFWLCEMGLSECDHRAGFIGQAGL